MTHQLLGNPVPLMIRANAGATDSPSPRLRMALQAASVYTAQWLTVTEITTSCFLLFYCKVSREAYFAYSDSESCLLICTYCMFVWNKSE